MEDPHATVFETEDGKLVIDDPTAVGMIRAVNKYNCLGTLKAQTERVKHFVGRMEALGRTPDEVVIVLINADDIHGRHLAYVLMPDMDWQPFRDRGEVPFARGLAERSGLVDAISFIDQDASDKLKQHKGIAVVVVDNQTAEIFSPEDAE